MLPWSVSASARISRRAASSNSWPTRAAPSSIENSVWQCRCTNDEELTGDSCPGTAMAHGLLVTASSTVAGIPGSLTRGEGPVRLWGSLLSLRRPGCRGGPTLLAGLGGGVRHASLVPDVRGTFLVVAVGLLDGHEAVPLVEAPGAGVGLERPELDLAAKGPHGVVQQRCA